MKFTISFVVIGLIACLSFFMFSTPSPEKDIRSQYLKAGNFKLFSDRLPFELSQLKGHPVILYFGYTSCPDVCPVGLAVIRDVLNSTEEFLSVPTLFVTIDPVRDTSEILTEYVSFFHKNIIPLSGSIQQIRSVIESYGGFFRHSMKGGGEHVSSDDDYLVDHSAYYYLIDANGELTRVLDHSVTVKELSESLRPLL
jgi:protein SCO1/2